MADAERAAVAREARGQLKSTAETICACPWCLRIVPKQRLFVREYCVTMSAGAAALKAGYSKKSAGEIGCMLLKDDRIIEAINHHQGERVKAVDLEAETILRKMWEIVERCMTATPVLDREGKETGEWTFDATNAIKALHLLGQRHPKLWPKVAPQVTINPTVYNDNRILELFPNREALLEAAMKLPDEDE